MLSSGLATGTVGLFLLFLAYWMILAPCYGLCNSLAMRHLRDPGRDFGGVRLWGTTGWLVAGWLVSLVMAFSGAVRSAEGAYPAFLFATGVSLVTAYFCASSASASDRPSGLPFGVGCCTAWGWAVSL
jgi:hypothetical protein